MIGELRSRVLRRLARLLLRSGTFRRHLGVIDADLDPRFLRAAGLLRQASDQDALFVRDLINGVMPDIPLWVLHETGWKRGGYFVEFGVADGKTLSNTYLLENKYGWRGIVAEPNPGWHDELRRTRKRQSTCGAYLRPQVSASNSPQPMRPCSARSLILLPLTATPGADSCTM